MRKMGTPAIGLKEWQVKVNEVGNLRTPRSDFSEL
jgi:hypothetical protein